MAMCSIRSSISVQPGSDCRKNIHLWETFSAITNSFVNSSKLPFVSCMVGSSAAIFTRWFVYECAIKAFLVFSSSQIYISQSAWISLYTLLWCSYKQEAKDNKMLNNRKRQRDSTYWFLVKKKLNLSIEWVKIWVCKSLTYLGQCEFCKTISHKFKVTCDKHLTSVLEIYATGYRNRAENERYPDYMIWY